MLKPIEYRGQTFDRTHGSPFDRGSVEPKDMSIAEMRAYFMGYEYNEQFGDKKSWD